MVEKTKSESKPGSAGLGRRVIAALPKEATLILIFVVFCIVLSILTPRFFTVQNLRNLVRQTATIGVVSLGMTYVIISGGIDLSVGSVLAFAGISGALLMVGGTPIVLAVIVALALGALLGLVNGIAIHEGRVPPFVATLGMMTAARGLTMLVSGARMVTGLPRPFVQFAQITIVGLPALFFVWLLLIIASIMVTQFSRFGRNVFAIGSNREAARLSGINIRLNTYGVYMVSGFMAAVGGLMMTSRLANGVPTAGQMYELDAIAAAVVGGASLMGGEGTIIGTVVGAMIIATIRNGGNLLGVNPFVLQVLIGVLVVVAVMIDQMNKGRSE
ncbi:MAG: ABC transporter permease [Spirochaetaceae bacterium]|nr:MAG: ABC transporter permease [Spirochaetaceae bacterium]